MGSDAPSQAQAGANQYGYDRWVFGQKLDNALDMAYRRANQDPRTQGLIDQVGRSSFEQALQNQSQLAASNRTRNQAAAQRDMARNIAQLQGQQATAVAQMKYQDIVGGQQAYADLVQQHLGRLMGATEQARSTGAQTGAQSDTQNFWNLGPQWMSGLGKGISGGAMAFSDERTKENFKSPKKSIAEFLAAASKSKEYEYKEEYHGDLAKPGRHVTPMAQDLEKTEIGKSMVKEMPNGMKAVDYGAGFGAMLASLGDINERLKKVEEKE